MRDLRFKEDRTTLKHVLERGITTTNQDKCIIFSEVRGYCQDDFIQKTYASTVYNQMVGTEHLGAIQITTAAGICAPLDLLLQGKIKQRSGFVRLEDIPFMDFLGNEFGQYYRDDKALGGICP